MSSINRGKLKDIYDGGEDKENYFKTSRNEMDAIYEEVDTPVGPEIL